MDLLSVLRQAGFGVTTFSGQGREGAVMMLFAVAKRKRGPELMHLVQKVDRDAFITVEGVTGAVGGYMPYVTEPTSVRK